MSDESVGLVRVAAPELVVPPAAWEASGFALPILLSRDVIIEGDERLSEWPILYFKGAKEKMKLAGNVTLHVMNMFLKDMRSKPTRAPGLDILAPTDPDVAPSTVIFGPAAGSFGVCWPLFYQVQDFMLLERPSKFPGKNALGTYETREMLLQEGCVEDRSAAPTKRCWASKIFTPDLAAYGADYDAVKDRLVPNNQLYHAVNSMAYCEMLVDDYCLTVEAKDPLLCFTEAERRYDEFVMGGGSAAGSSSGSGSIGVSLSPALGAQTLPPAVIWEYGTRTSSSGLTEGARIGLICGASVAGALLLAGVSATVAVVRARRRRRQQESGYGVSDVKATGGRRPSKLTRIFFVRMDSISGGTTSSASPASPAELGPGGCDAAPSAANLSAGFTSSNASAALTTLNGGVQQRSTTLLLPPRPTEDKPVTPLTKPRRELSLNVQLIDLAAATTASSTQQQQQRKLGSEAVVAKAGEAPSDECTAEGSVIIDVAAPNEEGANSGGDGDGSAAGGGDGSAAGGGDGRAGGPPVVELLPVTLGRGTFGRVVQGMFCGRKVAVKLMAGEAVFMGGGDGEPKADAEKADEGRHYSNVFLQSFVQEVQVLSRLQHRNVVKLLAACVTPPRLCLVMELMETSLEALLYGGGGGGGGGGQGGGRGGEFGNTFQQSPRHNPLMPLEKVLHIGIEIATALAYLHPTIVHRDLKPANVLVNEAASDRPIIKLTDFGLSRLRVTVATTKHPDAGTPPYMAPECFDVTNGRITHKSDIYSLGIMLWEMLVGIQPWAGMAPVAIAFLVAYKGGRPPLDALNKHRCPPKLMRLIKSCWETDPDRRPAAAEAAKAMVLLLMEVKELGAARQHQHAPADIN